MCPFNQCNQQYVQFYSVYTPLARESTHTHTHRTPTPGETEKNNLILINPRDNSSARPHTHTHVLLIQRTNCRHFVREQKKKKRIFRAELKRLKMIAAHV